VAEENPPSGHPAAGGDVSDDLLSKFDSLINDSNELNEDIGTTSAKVAAENQLLLGQDRSWIAKTIIATYAAAVTLALLYILLTSPNCGLDKITDCAAAAAKWKTQAELFRDLIVTAVLPIVTLMLGFYFGTETSKAAAPPANL